MPWIVGVDEAGYGPNLGPLVMTSVAVWQESGDTSAGWWERLAPAVRKAVEREDDRIHVADSKQVFVARRGLAELERAVLAHLLVAGVFDPTGAGHLQGVLGPIAVTPVDQCVEAPWCNGATAVPVASGIHEIMAAASRLAESWEDAGLRWGSVRCDVMWPERFNRVVDRWESKSAALELALQLLVEASRRDLGDREGIVFVIDKHGGRNNYAPMLQSICPDGVVLARQESMLQSHYTVEGLGRPLSFTFRPRADDGEYVVSLASMISKLLRELLMAEFNAYWKTHIPELRPTAGYPVDAARFLGELAELLVELEIPKDRVWRKR